MSSADETSASPEAGTGARGLGRVFALILVTQVVVVVALYWFGRHFS